eukprot:4065066-Pleurochrysis_carterae.AAC.1
MLAKAPSPHHSQLSCTSPLAAELPLETAIVRLSQQAPPPPPEAPPTDKSENKTVGFFHQLRAGTERSSFFRLPGIDNNGRSSVVEARAHGLLSSRDFDAPAHQPRPCASKSQGSYLAFVETPRHCRFGADAFEHRFTARWRRTCAFLRVATSSVTFLLCTVCTKSSFACTVARRGLSGCEPLHEVCVASSWSWPRVNLSP